MKRDVVVGAEGEAVEAATGQVVTGHQEAVITTGKARLAECAFVPINHLK